VRLDVPVQQPSSVTEIKASERAAHPVHGKPRLDAEWLRPRVQGASRQGGVEVRHINRDVGVVDLKDVFVFQGGEQASPGDS